MQTGNEIPDWRITGDWWDLCNCAIGCPCNFGSDPTYGFCEGVLTWLIRDGHYGDLNFTKDLAVVLISHWEGNVMEKNREFGFLIDDRANSAERDALERIFTGYAGGAFAAWRDLTICLDGVEFVPMTVTHDAESWRVQVPGLVDGLGGPYRKYMVPSNDTCRIYNAPRPEVVPGFLTVGEAKRNVVTGGAACYQAGGCADIIDAVAQRIDARQFNPGFPQPFPRFVQHAIWRYCAQSGLDVCNGNRIDDRQSCTNLYCQLHKICDRISLFSNCKTSTCIIKH